MDQSTKAVLMRRIDEALNGVRPHLHVDGGDVTVLDVSDDFVVKVQWEGNCQHCEMSPMTLRAGIEKAIIDRVPEIKKVQPVN